MPNPNRLAILPGNIWNWAYNQFDIAHGCNTEGVMGVGIALQVKQRYPLVFETYRINCVTARQANFALEGKCLAVKTPWHQTGRERTVFNLFTQDKRGRNARIEWVYSSVVAMFNDRTEPIRKNILMPPIGCGYGGLKVPEVIDTINDAIIETDFSNRVVMFFR